MKQFKKLLTFSVLVFAIATCAAQTDNKDVTITASGSGPTLDAAKQSALRSAIEQAYGAFISTKTEMLNDQVVADEMTSVSAGNIKSYEVLNQDSLPDGRWGLTLKAVVSVDKLTSFVEAKGGTIEIKGGMFALNIKQQLLNEQGEIKAIAEMIGLLHEPMQTAFDYTIKSGTPQSLDAESKNWEIPLEVTATCNKNMELCVMYCIKTIAALSLGDGEVTSYKSLNKEVFPVVFYFNSESRTFYLRKQKSINLLNTLTSNWEFYTRLFIVQSGMDESIGKGEGNLHDFSGSKIHNNSSKAINLITNGQVAAVFSLRDKRTLSQIEQMSGYQVKPRGVISPFKNGGFVVYEENGHGLVVSLCDINFSLEESGDRLPGDRTAWPLAKQACDDWDINGYTDWRLPTKEEAIAIGQTLGVLKMGNFLGLKGYGTGYWTSSASDSRYYWHVDLIDGEASDDVFAGRGFFRVRAVRNY